MKHNLQVDNTSQNARMSDMKSVIRSQFEEKYYGEESTFTRSNFHENKKTDFTCSPTLRAVGRR